MQPHRTPAAPDRPATKGCPACGATKQASEFYVSCGRLSSYCKPCQRRVSTDAYRRRRQDAAERERIRQRDRARKRAERARFARVDPDRERRAGQARTAAVRRLIAAHRQDPEPAGQDGVSVEQDGAVPPDAEQDHAQDRESGEPREVVRALLAGETPDAPVTGAQVQAATGLSRSRAYAVLRELRAEAPGRNGHAPDRDRQDARADPDGPLGGADNLVLWLGTHHSDGWCSKSGKAASRDTQHDGGLLVDLAKGLHQ